jgi:ribonucleoside-diphosphate reductase alpha chain
MAVELESKDLSRPEILAGRTIRVRSPFGTVFVTLNESPENSPIEVFLKAGKCGSDLAADAEAIGRLCSLLLRIPSPVPEIQRIEAIIENLVEIGGSKNIEAGTKKIRSVPDALAFALQQYLDHKRK